MSRMIAFGRTAILFSIFAVSLGAAVVEAQGKPQVTVPEAIFDFGTVAQGTKVKHDFKIKNAGDADLYIQGVVPTCGCTVAAPSSDKVAPGQETTIHVEFDTTGFSGDRTKIVRVNTSDMTQPSSTLTLKGTVEPDLIVEPQRVTFGDIARGAKDNNPEQTVTVRIKEGAATKLGEIKSFSPLLVLKELESTSQVKRFTVAIKPDAPVGEIRERVVVGLEGSSSRSSVDVPVFASIRGALQIKPSTLSFGLLEGAAEVERSVRFENASARKVKIVSINSDNPLVKVDYKQIEDGKIYVLKVRVDPTKVKNDLRASVTIATDDAEQSSLTLNVYGIVPPKA